MLGSCQKKSCLKQTNHKYTHQKQTFIEYLWIETEVTFITPKKLALAYETRYIYIAEDIKHCTLHEIQEGSESTIRSIT